MVTCLCGPTLHRKLVTHHCWTRRDFLQLCVCRHRTHCAFWQAERDLSQTAAARQAKARWNDPRPFVAADALRSRTLRSTASYLRLVACSWSQATSLLPATT